MTIRFLAIALLINVTALGQTNLSGTWTLRSKQHVIGPEYGNALAKQVTIHQQPDSLIFETVNIGAEGQDVNSRYTVPANGKPLTTLSADNKRKYVKSLKWNANNKELVVTTVFYMEENLNEVDFTRVDILSLSPEGKQLNFDRKSVETRSETWQVKGVYDKK